VVVGKIFVPLHFETMEKFNEAAGKDRLRVLVATDNHLGFLENDPVRGEDSFRTMEEIFEVGRRCKVDMAVLGGDLFHINKPTRNTLVKAFDIFKRYVRGGGDVDLVVRGKFGHNGDGVNFEDENLAIDMPIFIIHGNHDDPTRDGGSMKLLSAIDLLQSNGLVNYFGMVDKVDDVILEPILIEKGKAKLKLYGMGWLRDERMHRMFEQGKIKFKVLESSGSSDESEEDNDEDDVANGVKKDKAWLNVFMVHQNRDFKGRGAKNCFSEKMIPDFMDLTIFGHEHECMIEPVASVHNDEVHLCQPGSPVATQLIESESVEKHCGILEVFWDESDKMVHYELHPIVLRTVRPFVFEDIALNSVDILSKDAAEEEKMTQVEQALEQKVKEMIADGQEKYKARNPDLSEAAVKKVLPLLRLRVEHTDFPVINMQRFGEKFIEKVANPKDMLFFYKKRVARATSAKKSADDFEDADIDFAEDTSPATRINGLISQNLQKDQLKLIPDKEFHLHIEDYVGKSEARALETYLNDLLEKTQQLQLKRLKEKRMDDQCEVREEDIFQVVEGNQAERNKKAGEELVKRFGNTSEEEPKANEKTKIIDQKGKRKKILEDSEDENADEDIEMGVNGDDGLGRSVTMSNSSSKRKAASSGGAGKSSTSKSSKDRKSSKTRRTLESEEVEEEDESAGEIDEDDIIAATPKKRTRTTRKAARSKRVEIEDDEASKPKAKKPRTTPIRKAHGKSKNLDVIDLEDDSD